MAIPRRGAARGLLSSAWDAPREDGISRVSTEQDRLRAAAGFLDLPGAAHVLRSLTLARDLEGSLSRLRPDHCQYCRISGYLGSRRQLAPR